MYIIVLKLTPRIFRTNKNANTENGFPSFYSYNSIIITPLQCLSAPSNVYNVHIICLMIIYNSICTVFSFYVICTLMVLDLNEFSAVMNPWQWVRVTRDLCRRLASFVNATTCTSYDGSRKVVGICSYTYYVIL